MPHLAANIGSPCGQCGTTVSPDARFCSKCGTAAAHPLNDAPSAPPAPGPEVGHIEETLRQDTAGDYEIIGELGRGGMATVFLAHDLSLDRRVAIKVMAPELRTADGMAERFTREARTSAALSHPHIIPVYAVKQTNDLLFFVMKYIQGRALDSVVADGGALPIPVVQTILAQVGSALAYAHAKGVVHRDIKPANIILDDDGWAIVTDFGIAKVAESQGLTRTGGTVGTPTYMSPEQCMGTEVTGASDQYSLGLVACEMLTGSLPFETGTVMSAMWAHVNEQPTDILSQRPDCPPEINAAVMRMLSKKAVERWPTVADAVAAIGKVSVEMERESRADIVALASAEPQNWAAHFRTPTSPIPPTKPWIGEKTIHLDATVEQRLSLVLSANARALTPGGSLRLNVILSDRSGAVLKDRPIRWSAGSPAVATVSEHGLVTAVAEGACIITASFQNVSDVCTVTVTPAPIALVEIEPAETTLEVRDKIRLEATALDTRGKRVTDRPILWESSDSSVATVSPQGIIAGMKTGTAIVTATSESATGTTTVVVRPATASQLTLQPDQPELDVGDSVELRAVALDKHGRQLPDQVRWTTSDARIAGVSTTGVVHAIAPGEAQIEAACAGATVATSVTVLQTGPVKIELSVQRGTVTPGERVRVTAEVLDADGAVLEGLPVIWSSSKSKVASVSEAGVITAAQLGSTVITAKCDEIHASMILAVTRVGVAKLVASAPSRTVPVGSKIRLEASASDQFGEPLSDRMVQWLSNHPAIARVSPAGVVTGQRPGTAQLTGSTSTCTVNVRIKVTPIVVAGIKVGPSQLHLRVGESQKFTATVQDPEGAEISGVVVEWASSNPDVAEISSDGVTTGRRDGTAVVAASYDGKRATARVSVTYSY